MSQSSRRQWLKGLLAGLAATGTVVCCRAVLPASEEKPAAPPAKPEERADQLASELPASPDGLEPVAFVNRAFRNVPGPAGFRNTGWVNGGFHNGGFRNGGFVNGGGFRNGGGGGFRNGAFRNF